MNSYFTTNATFDLMKYLDIIILLICNYFSTSGAACCTAVNLLSLIYMQLRRRLFRIPIEDRQNNLAIARTILEDVTKTDHLHLGNYHGTTFVGNDHGCCETICQAL